MPASAASSLSPRGRALRALLLLSALASGGAAAQDLVVDGTSVTIDADRTITGSVLVRNGGTLTLRGATVTLALGYDEEFRVEVAGSSRLVVENGTITSSGGQYWIELASDESGAPTLLVSGSASRLTNHSGIRPTGNARIEVTGGDVEEVQVRDRAVATVKDAGVYPVFFFPAGSPAVLDGLLTGGGISAAVSLQGGWSFTLSNATVQGYQLDLTPGADVTVSRSDGIVASFHTPGNLGAEERVVENATSPSRASGSVTSLGSRFVFNDTNVGLVNVYTFGTDRVLVRNVHVNEANAEGGSRLTIGQPGTSTRLSCNLCQAYDRATFTVDGAVIEAVGNVPSATTSYSDKLPPPGRGVLVFRNVDLRGVDLTARSEGTIRLCNSPVDPARVRVLDATARVETFTDCGASGGRGDSAELVVSPAAPASAQNAAFSPDGRRLLFTLFSRGYNLGDAGLHEQPFPTGVPVALLHEPGHAAVNLPGSAWSAATGRIAFASDREERDEIWTMRSNGTDPVRVTRGVAGGMSIEGSFSPDGARVVFESARVAGDARQGSVFSAKADGSELQRLTDGPGTGTDDRQPAWSPGGDRILLQHRAAGGTWHLATIPASGGATAPLTNGATEDTDAGWSPDGRFVVFSSAAGSASPGIFVLPATGGAPVRATTPPSGATDAAPAFSPDGRWITFESHSGGESPAAIWRIASPVAAAPPLVVPVVLDVATGSARYTTELFITNHGAVPSELRLTYTASIAGAPGSGPALESVPAGAQLRIPDALAYLRAKGLPLPSASEAPAQGGTLVVDVLTPAGAVSATARTTTETRAPQPPGRAGLAYTAVPYPAGIASRAVIPGLRATSADRSNLALFNVSPDPVAIRVTARSGAGDGAAVVLEPALTLPAWSWRQLDGVLSRAGMTNGWVDLERASTTGRFGAYGVVNDNGTNDGSFLLPAWGDRSTSAILVPVLVETPQFGSELILTNTGAAPAALSLSYVESLSPSPGAGGPVAVTLAPYEQRIVPSAIDFLRRGGASIGPAGAASYAGSLRVTAVSGGLADVLAGARASALSTAGGAFGLYAPGLIDTELATTGAWLDGLVADARSRANVALVHGGAPGTGSVALDVAACDGATGTQKPPLRVTLAPGEWRQLSGFLASQGVVNGSVRVRRVFGTAPWAAYGVVNDGAAPGEGTGDGAWVPMTPD